MTILGEKLTNIKRKIFKPDIEIPFIIPEKEPMLFDAVNMDINNKCNQRCRFCFSSFKDDPVNMDLKTYSNVLEVLPLVKEYAGGGYGFYFSCIYEPTIHPQFLDYLSMLPPEAKKKCFFTTNLARPMDKNFIKAMLSSNVGLINISIETFDCERFEYITQNKKFDHFKNNLLTLEKVINEMDGNIPRLRFITMLLNENKDEIIDLIEYCNTHFPIESYEIRTPYLSIYENMEWNKKQLLEKKEIDELIVKIKDLNCHIDIDVRCKEDLKVIDNNIEPSGIEKELDIYEKAREKLNKVEDYEYMFLRITPDGQSIDKITNIPEPIDLKDSTKYFNEILFKLYTNKAKAACCSSYTNDGEINGDAFILIDKLSENDVFIELTGWCCPDRKIDTDKLIIRLTGKEGDIHYFHTSTRKRFDADEFKQKEKGWCGGFSTYIEKTNLKEKEYFVDFLFKDYSDKTICYTWENGIKLN